jgi:hypothetical protein
MLRARALILELITPCDPFGWTFATMGILVEEIV